MTDHSFTPQIDRKLVRTPAEREAEFRELLDREGRVDLRVDRPRRYVAVGCAVVDRIRQDVVMRCETAECARAYAERRDICPDCGELMTVMFRGRCICRANDAMLKGE